MNNLNDETRNPSNCDISSYFHHLCGFWLSRKGKKKNKNPCCLISATLTKKQEEKKQDLTHEFGILSGFVPSMIVGMGFIILISPC